MSARQLLERLKELGIDSKVLKKIGRQIENSDKEVKPKSVVKFLLKNRLITKSQATGLVEEIEAPVAVAHEEIEVSQQKEYDTDDLTATAQEAVPEPDPEPEPVVSAPDYDPAADKDSPVDLVEVARPIVEPEVEVPPAVPVAPEPVAATAMDPGLDPFGGATDAMSQGGYGDSGGPGKPTGFQGKKLRKDQWATKWMLIGPAILLMMLMVGAILYYSLSRVSAEDQFKSAMSAFDRNAWSDFLDKGQAFVDNFPSNKNTPKVRALLVQSLIAQTYEQGNWDETILRAKTHLPPLVEDEEIQMDWIRDDLGVTVANSALEISRRAAGQTELVRIEEELKKAVAAREVFDNPAYISSTARKTERLSKITSEIVDNIEAARGLIRKENDYDQALVSIKELADAGKTDDAFQNFETLRKKYGDLAARQELRDLMKIVSTKEQALVVPCDVNVQVLSDAPASSIETSIVLASPVGTMVEASRGVIIPVFVNGTLFGIDSGNGHVAWRRFLGFETSLPWKEFDADTLIVCDQKLNDVYRIRRVTGEIVWRAAIGESFLEPAIAESMIVVTTRSGKVIRMNPQSGEVTGSVQLPQKASVGAMIAEREPYIYQPGHYANLYVLSQEDLSCKSVYYLGHDPGSIQIPPTQWTGLVLICVNGGDFCDLNVFRNTEEGLKLLQLMTRQVNGPVTTPLMRYGRRMLMASENGNLSVLSNDSTNEETPITTFVKQSYDNRKRQKAYYLARGNRLYLGSHGILKYKIGNVGGLEKETILDANDDFIADFNHQNDVLFHVRRRNGSSMISVSAVSADTLNEIWRSEIGGPVAGSPIMFGNSLVAISSQGDMFTIGSDEFQSGSAFRPEKSSEIISNLMFDHVVKLTESTGVAFGTGRSDMLHFDTAGENLLVKLNPPGNRIACAPVAHGSDVLIATETGWVMRIDPKTGNRIGEPFQAAVVPGETIEWSDPAFVDDNTLAIARNPENGESAFYLLDISDRNSGIRELANSPATGRIESRLALAGSNLYAVVANEENEKSLVALGASDLSVAGTAALADGYVEGPWVVGNSVLVRNLRDQLVAFDRSLNAVWTCDLPAGRIAGVPSAKGSGFVVTLQDGRVLQINPADGSISGEMDLGQPVLNQPVEFGGRMFFSGTDGTIHVAPAGAQP